MLQTKAVIEAAKAWLRVLQDAPENAAWPILQSNPTGPIFGTETYRKAIDWLEDITIVEGSDEGRVLAPRALGLSFRDQIALVFQASLAREQPPWLADADTSIASVVEIPPGALDVADALGLPPEEALIGIREVCGKIDLERRREIGLAGEMEVVRLLELSEPGCSSHVALANDGFGYDVAYETETANLHLEVKATTRRGRLVVHLSRTEYDRSLLDPHWRLVIVGLTEELTLACVAHVAGDVLAFVAPEDRLGSMTQSTGKWSAAAIDLKRHDLRLGLPGMASSCADWASMLDLAGVKNEHEFDWAPHCVDASFEGGA